jgi:hypothetical protein
VRIGSSVMRRHLSLNLAEGAHATAPGVGDMA